MKFDIKILNKMTGMIKFQLKIGKIKIENLFPYIKDCMIKFPRYFSVYPT